MCIIHVSKSIFRIHAKFKINGQYDKIVTAIVNANSIRDVVQHLTTIIQKNFIFKIFFITSCRKYNLVQDCATEVTLKKIFTLILLPCKIKRNFIKLNDTMNLSYCDPNHK